MTQKTSFLLDTGAEVSLIDSSVPGLNIQECTVTPVSITHQLIAVKGEAEVHLKLGELETTWKFLWIDRISIRDRFY